MFTYGAGPGWTKQALFQSPSTLVGAVHFWVLNMRNIVSSIPNTPSSSMPHVGRCQFHSPFPYLHPFHWSNQPTYPWALVYPQRSLERLTGEGGSTMTRRHEREQVDRLGYSSRSASVRWWGILEWWGRGRVWQFRIGVGEDVLSIGHKGAYELLW